MNYRSEALRYPLVQALAVVALAELALNRAVTRVGVFIPKSGLVADVYSVVVALSTPLFAATALIALAHVLLMMVQLLDHPARRRSVLRLGAGLAVAGVLAISVVLGGQQPSLARHAAYGSLVLVVALALVGLAAPERRPATLTVALAGGSILVATTLPGLGQAAGSSRLTAAAVPMSALAEALVLAASVPLALALGRRPIARRAALFSAALGGVFCAGYLAAPAMMATMAIWTIGLTLYLPFPLYALALSLWCYAALAGQERVGLVLLLAAGCSFAVSVHHLIFLSAIYSLAAPQAQPLTAPAQQRPAMIRRPANG